jgi:hypothetical protein
MERIKPAIAVAALMGAIVGEGWLRTKMHLLDKDYVGLRDLIGSMAVQMPRRGRPWTLRPSSKSGPRSYRGSSSWSSGSNVASLEGHPGE